MLFSTIVIQILLFCYNYIVRWLILFFGLNRKMTIFWWVMKSLRIYASGFGAFFILKFWICFIFKQVGFLYIFKVWGSSKTIAKLEYLFNGTFCSGDLIFVQLLFMFHVNYKETNWLQLIRSRFTITQLWILSLLSLV